MKGMLTCIILFYSQVSVAAAFFVDTNNGMDSHDGSSKKPFGTILKAQMAVRELIQEGLSEEVTVFIHSGEYALTEPLLFDSRDSGTGEHSITYTGCGTEKPLIHGGVKISGFTRTPDGLWQATVPQVKNGSLWFRSLFKDGKRLIRSRWPNDRCIKIKYHSEDWKEFELKEPLPEGYTGNPASELIIIQNWSTSRSLVAGLKAGRLTTQTPHGRPQHPWTSVSIGKSAWLEHDRTFVDMPGEWHLDPESGVLTYMPHEGEEIESSVFIAPVLEKLIVMKGTEEKPVLNVHFQGLQFACSHWPLPEIGFLGIQAGYYGYERHGEPKVPAYSPPAMIEWRYARACGIKDCTITGTEASAIGLGAGCRQNRITGCRLDDIGISGILIGHRHEPVPDLDNDWDTPGQVPEGNVVENNYLTRCGSVYYDGVGIFTAFTDGTVIRHNLLHDMSYVGISVGFKWKAQPTSMKNCILEYNRVYNVIQKVSDAGGIYTLGLQPGTRIHGNMVYNIEKSPFATPTLHDWANNAFFFDAGSKGFVISENIAFNAGPRPVRFNRNTSIGGNPNAEEGMTWFNNYLDMDIEDPAFPWDIAAKAGLTPAYKHLLEN